MEVDFETLRALLDLDDLIHIERVSCEMQQPDVVRVLLSGEGLPDDCDVAFVQGGFVKSLTPVYRQLQPRPRLQFARWNE